MRVAGRASILALLAANAVAMASACIESTGPYAGEVLGTATNRVASGLAHHLAVVRSTRANEATLNSILVNEGSAAIRVIVRSCTLVPEDVAADPGITPQWPLVDCARMVDTLDLAPGASSPVLALTLAIAPGTRTGATITVRHAVTPGLRTSVTLLLRD